MGEAHVFKVLGATGSDLAHAIEAADTRVVRCVTTIEEPQIEIDLDERHVDIVLKSLEIVVPSRLLLSRPTVSSEQFMRGSDLQPLRAERSPLIRSIFMRFAHGNTPVEQQSGSARGQRFAKLIGTEVVARVE